MSRTVVSVDTHSGIEHFLPEMWPHYLSSGADVVGVERTNKPTKWPEQCQHKIAVGEDLFQRWCEHKHPTLLCARMLDTVEALLAMSQYDNFCMSTWSALFAKPLPQPMPYGLMMHIAGHNKYSEGFKSPYLFHYPFWFDRKHGEIILETGRKLLRDGETEMGANDFFLGLIIATARISWEEVPGYTCNGLDAPFYIEQARKHLRDGAWWIGNIKNKSQLDALLAP